MNSRKSSIWLWATLFSVSLFLSGCNTESLDGSSESSTEAGNEDSAGDGNDDSGNSGDTQTPTYTVTTQTGSGGSITPASISAVSNQTANFTLSTDNGYSIDSVSGCSGNLNGTTYTTGPITSNCTVSARFKPTAYLVNTQVGVGGHIEPARASVVYGDTTSFTLSADGGYVIESVTGCSGTLVENIFTTGAITNSCTISASFSESPRPNVSISDGEILEGDSETTTLILNVMLSEPSDTEVQVAYTTHDDTALAGSDYTAASGTLTIPANATSGEISLSILGDTEIEPSETFTVILDNVSTNATLGTSTATVTITNDDLDGTLGEAGPNVTDIYPATVTHAVASPISDTVIADSAERSRWSSNVPLSAGYHEFWVAPNVPEGQGDGTEANPWDLYSALNGTNNGDRIPDNSIVWLKQGDYVSPRLNTADQNPETYGNDPLPLWPVRRMQGDVPNNRGIHFRPELGAKVRLDGGVNFTFVYEGSGVWLWDVEMTSIASPHTEGDYHFREDDFRPQPDYLIPMCDGYGGTTQCYIDIKQWLLDHNSIERNGSAITAGNYHALINTVSHRLSAGYYSWKRAKNALIYGCIAYDNGLAALDRLHGPGVYAQNESATPRRYDENIVAGNFSNPFQLYSATSGGEVLGSMHGEGNIVFGARKIADGEAPFRRRLDVMFGKNGGEDQQFRENYIYGHELETGAYDASNMVFENNYVLYSKSSDCLACEGHGNIVENIPTTQRIHIRPNAYDPRKANLIVINPNRDPVISISLGEFAQAGDHIEVYNSIDLNVDSEPLTQGVYNGEYFNLSMPGSSNPDWTDWPWNAYQPDNPADSEDPFDYSTVKHEFWAFVLIKTPQ